MLENIFLHIQNPHDQMIITRLILVLYVYPESSNHRLKMQKRFTRRSLGLETSWIVFAALNGDCSAQDGHREPKLVWL
jgi:hypothetical protein